MEWLFSDELGRSLKRTWGKEQTELYDMTVFDSRDSLPVLLIGASVLLFSLYLMVRFLSGKPQRGAVEALREYFCLTVCPRRELAPYLRELPPSRSPLWAGRLPEKEPLHQWVEREAEERSSPYYFFRQYDSGRVGRTAPVAGGPARGCAAKPQPELRSFGAGRKGKGFSKVFARANFQRLEL